MSLFISLPYKTTESLDWTISLNNFLTSTFGRSFTAEITSSIEQLNKLRIDIEHSNIKDAEKIIPIFLNYIVQLDSLGLRLPMDIVIASNELEFCWTDVFGGKSKPQIVKQKSLSFEKASVLFNLSSLYSYLGIKSASALDWKNAILYFTHASGILKFISKHFLHSPTNDLAVDLTKGYSYLMLAQGQECFLWNYMQSPGGLKHSLVSRLSEGVGSTYKLAYDLLSPCNFKINADEIDFKASYFHAFALFHSSQNYMESKQVGYAIVVNQITKDTLNSKLTQTNKNINSGLTQLCKELNQEVKSKLSELEKDNDLIYNQPLPSTSNIPSVKAMEGAKEVPLEVQLQKFEFKDLFDKIVPMEAHKGMSIYSERQAEILRDYNDRVSVSNEKVQSFFEFSKLPNTIIDIRKLLKDSNPVTLEEDREKEDDYPRVLAMAHELENSLGSNYLKDMENVEKKREGILKQLDNADEYLSRDDKNTLVKGLSENSELNKLKDEVLSTRRILTEAGISDSKLLNLWNKFETEIKVLQSGTNGVQKWLNDSTSDNSVKKLSENISLLDIDDDIHNSDELDLRTADHLIEHIYQLKKSLELLVDERNSTLTDLKNSMHNEDISSVLIKYSGAREDELEKVFDEQLKKYESYTSRIDGLVSLQDDKILELKDLLNRLLDLPIVKKKVEKKKTERSTVKVKISRLINAYDSWKLCTKGSSEALEFYTRLIGRTSNIVNKIHDIVNQRENYSSDPRPSVSSITSGGFGGYTMNIPQYQQQPPPPGYSIYNTGSGLEGTSGPPLPSKPNYTGNQPYTTPSVYDPDMYSQFGQNWKQ